VARKNTSPLVIWTVGNGTNSLRYTFVIIADKRKGLMLYCKLFYINKKQQVQNVHLSQQKVVFLRSTEIVQNFSSFRILS